jgi:CBS domain-containing protein
VSEVLSVMSNAQIRRVPVVNASDELVGIVSMRDISTETNQNSNVGKAVEQISQGPANN